jgi:aubergine-like protein
MEADWGRSVVKETVITAVSLNNWILVFTKRDADKARNFMTMMKKACPPMGIDVVDASFIELPNDRTESFIKAVRSRINSSLQLVVVIFPSPRDDRYSSIKKLCCIESPVPSQVINARTISQQQKLRSVTQKIALQINVKLGGELWALEIPLKNVMVIGIDVFHDNARGRRSVLGFVSSTNKTFTRWFSRVTIQDMNQEIGDGLKICFQNALSKYHELNNTLPDRIIIYRDGVGDGQMNMVYDFEVPQLKNCLVMFGNCSLTREG